MKLYIDYIKTVRGFWVVEAEDFGVNSIKLYDSKPKIETKRNNITDGVISYLISYFEGNNLNVSFPLNMFPYTEFQKSVWNELLKIPYGTTISYKSLARRLGNPSAIRAVAAANGKNPFPILVPCHRVIGSDGSMTGYAYGIPLKEYLLDLENAIPVKQMTLF